MDRTNLCDLLEQSTSFTPEMCQKMSFKINELFDHKQHRPSFPSLQEPSLLKNCDEDTFWGLLEQAFDAPSANAANGIYGLINLTPQSSINELTHLAKDMALGGIAIVQLRPKNCSKTHIIQAARAVQKELAPDAIPFVLNDDPQLAAQIGTYGVHLGQSDASPADVKKEFPQLCIGHSTHHLAQVESAHQNEAVHWIALGPIFESPTKKGHADIVGLKTLTAACDASRKPLIAIGGITSPYKAFQIGRSGAKYAAVVSALAHPEQTRHNALVLNFSFWLGQQTKEVLS